MAFSRGFGLPGRVWVAGQPVWIRDVTIESNFPRAPAARVDGLHSAIGFPMLGTSGATVGVIEYFTDEFLTPVALLTDLFRDVGALTGPAVER